MNYDQARELRDENGHGTGRWHFTNRNDDRIRPIGYCAHSCPGHDTSEGAERHYWQWELDEAELGKPPAVVPGVADGRVSCKLCQEPATATFRMPGGWEAWPICPMHFNRASLQELHPFQPGRQIIHC